MSATIPHVRSIRESVAALLVALPDGRELWCPKSVIDDDSEVFSAKTTENRETGTLIVADWFAEKNGLDRKIDASDGEQPDDGLTGVLPWRK